MKASIEIKQGHGFRNFLIILCLALMGFSYLVWNKYQDEKKSAQIKAENASADYKLRGDSLYLLQMQGDSIELENKKLSMLIITQKKEYKIKLAAQVKELKDVETLPPDKQVDLFAEKTNCTVLLTTKGIYVPIEGVKTANILLTEGEQAKINVIALSQIIDTQNKNINGIDSLLALKYKEKELLKSQNEDLNIIINGKNKDISNKDKKISIQKKAIRGTILGIFLALLL